MGHTITVQVSEAGESGYVGKGSFGYRWIALQKCRCPEHRKTC